MLTVGSNYFRRLQLYLPAEHKLASGDSKFTLCLLGEEADYTSDIYTVPLSLKLDAVGAFTSKTGGSSAG